ncbi:MAG: nuclear transport factor 2 family protein [Woeseiaceae bacterium]
MRSHKFVQLATLFACLALAPLAFASDEEDLKRMLNEFLTGASVGNIDAHANFWHDALVYTSSNGTRRNKAEILEAVSNSPPPGDAGPGIVYTAEDVNINIYGDTAIVAFRLIGTPQSAVDEPINEYFNTGTFLKAEGTWSVIAWQATRIPPSADAQ